MSQSLGYIFILGYFLGYLFEKIRIPNIIGYLVAGIVLGPFAMNVLDDGLMAVAGDLRQITLLIILTRAGLSLKFKDFKKMGRKIFIVPFLPACSEMLATFLIAQWFFNLQAMDALLLAAVVASSSPAVVVPRMVKLINENYGTKKGIPQLILAGDSIDNVFNVVVFATVLAMQTSGDFAFSNFIVVPIAVISGIVTGLLIGYLIAKLLKLLQAPNEIKTLLLLSVGFVLLAFEERIDQFIPFSALISVMAMGVAILHFAPKNASVISEQLSKLWVGAQIILFALVGSTVDISYATTISFKAVLMLVLVLIARSAGILICHLGSDYTRKERFFCVMSEVPKATVQAAIGGIPLAMGLASGEIILSISVISILFTAPLGAFLIDTFYQKLLTKDDN
jgi:NhaP-type Na+/H+ or K+/H+ antiporter